MDGADSPYFCGLAAYFVCISHRTYVLFWDTTPPSLSTYVLWVKLIPTVQEHVT